MSRGWFSTLALSARCHVPPEFDDSNFEGRPSRPPARFCLEGSGSESPKPIGRSKKKGVWAERTGDRRRRRDRQKGQPQDRSPIAGGANPFWLSQCLERPPTLATMRFNQADYWSRNRRGVDTAACR